MKKNWLQIIIRIYKIWSAVLLAVFLVIAEYRYRALYLWQCSTALVILLMLVNLMLLFHKKHKPLKMEQERKLLEQRLEGKE